MATPNQNPNQGAKNNNVIEEKLLIAGLRHVETGARTTVQLPPLDLVQEDQNCLAEKKYKIGFPLRSGGFGVIYAVTHGTSYAEKAMACKVIQLGGLSQNYAHEVTRWKEMKHPNVMPAKEILMLREPVRLMVVMEVGDFDLQDLVLNQPSWVPKKLAAQYYYQLNRGLAYMHARNFAHRNLKPRNLLIAKARGMELRLSDCGMSRVSFAAQHPESVVDVVGWHETFGYLAPEVLGNVPNYCPMLADMWSVGCILFFMLYKSQPFQSGSRDIVELLHKQKNFQLTLNRRVEPPKEKGEGNIDEAKKVMVFHWNQDPTKRPTSKQIMTDATFYSKWSNWWPTATPGIATWYTAFMK